MHWWTGDSHFNHVGIIEYCNRDFKNIWAMNEHLIQCWNERVAKGDLVYVHGDFVWGQGKGYGTLGVEEIVKRLNGQIILIEGDHDKPSKKLAHLFVKIVPMLTTKIQKANQWLTMCHYCMRTWPRSHYNSWHTYAHSHNRLEPVGKSLDVGVDGHNYYPWSEDEIINYMEKRLNNFNYVGDKNGK